MSFVPFAMERWQSTYEHEVAVNLSESGVHPLTARELLELGGRGPEVVADVLLEYIQSNGNAALRERVASLHPGANVDGVLVTSGSAEANFVTLWTLRRPGDEVVFMAPNFFQVAGLTRNFGAVLRPWELRADRGWTPDPDALDELVNDRTRLIVVTHPNNPTGAVFDEQLLDRVACAAERVGAWVLSDEVYRGAELDGVETPSLFGRYDRVVVSGGLSKAYGLPGLRVGWTVTNSDTAAELWAHKDYTTISVTSISEVLAGIALEPPVRHAILDRTRGILRHNWPILKAWLHEREDCFSWTAPRAGAIVMVEFDLPVSSEDLVERARAEQDCLLIPGAHFDLPNHLRFGFGPPEDVLRDGLARLAAVIDPLRTRVTASGANEAGR